mgnify:CR=1 FL=1
MIFDILIIFANLLLAWKSYKKIKYANENIDLYLLGNIIIPLINASQSLNKIIRILLEKKRNRHAQNIVNPQEMRNINNNYE